MPLNMLAQKKKGRNPGRNGWTAMEILEIYVLILPFTVERENAFWFHLFTGPDSLFRGRKSIAKLIISGYSNTLGNTPK